MGTVRKYWSCWSDEARVLLCSGLFYERQKEVAPTQEPKLLLRDLQRESADDSSNNLSKIVLSPALIYSCIPQEIVPVPAKDTRAHEETSKVYDHIHGSNIPPKRYNAIWTKVKSMAWIRVSGNTKTG